MIELITALVSLSLTILLNRQYFYQIFSFVQDKLTTLTKNLICIYISLVIDVRILYVTEIMLIPGLLKVQATFFFFKILFTSRLLYFMI